MVQRIIKQIISKAKECPQRIVFPEGNDDRILYAIVKIRDMGIAYPIVLGDYDKIKWRAGELQLNLHNIEIINPIYSDKLEQYTNEFHNLRKNKGVTFEQAREMMKQVSYFGTMMVHMKDADGLVSGASHSTADTLRPALQIIKTKPDHKLASSYFIMIVQNKVYFFADCGLVVDPNAEELSEIALSTALSAKQYGIEPKVAMLSFSTHGSGKGPSVDKVVEATRLVKQKFPELCIDGEIQLDAAIVPEVAQKKCPESPLRGNANVLIFENLSVGNIGYKLVERLTHATAIGPIIQGLNAPVNDLSRGCSVEDIVDMCAVTVNEAQIEKNIHIPNIITNN